MRRRNLFAALFGATTLKAQGPVDGLLMFNESNQLFPNRVPSGSLLRSAHEDPETKEEILDVEIRARDPEFGHIEIRGRYGAIATVWKDGYVSGNASEALRLIVEMFAGPEVRK